MSDGKIKVYGKLTSGVVGGFVTELNEVDGYMTIPHYAEYNSTNKTIDFKFDSKSETLFSIDARAFVKDGMVSDVFIENGNLVIRFNTDAGQQDLNVPLTGIFVPENYYTKEEVDTKFRNHDVVLPFLMKVSASIIVENSVEGENSSQICFDEKTKTFVYMEGKEYYGGWTTKYEYMTADGTEPLQSVFFLEKQTNILYYWENGELKPVVDLVEVQTNLEELLNEVFPVVASLASGNNVSSIIEFTGKGTLNTLVWTVTRKGAALTPDSVTITRFAQGNTETIETFDNPESNTGECSASIEALGATTFTARVTANGQNKSASLTYNSILPLYYGFGTADSLLEDNISSGALTKRVATHLNGVVLQLENPTAGNYLIVAVPEGKTVQLVTNGGVLPVPMQEAKTDKRTIEGTDYNYNVYLSSNPIEAGTMEDVEIRIV